MRVANLPGIRRLPTYLNILRKLRKEGVEVTSAALIASYADLAVSVVRKDLEMTGAQGTNGKGYLARDLVISIESFLGWDNPYDGVLVGVGKMGSAILGSEEFRRQGLNIVTAFDVDIDKIGRFVHSIEIMPVSKMSSLIERLHIGIGVITVPNNQAQIVADLLVQAGITRIWSFASDILSVPEGVTVQREDLSAGLAELLVRSTAV